MKEFKEISLSQIKSKSTEGKFNFWQIIYRLFWIEATVLTHFSKSTYSYVNFYYFSNN